MSKNELNGEAEGTGEDLSRKRIFTTGEAAAVCKVSQQTIIRCFDAGRLQGFRVPGSKFRRIPREELIRFMKANNIPLEALEGGKRRILIVDDDPAIVDVYVDLLGRDSRLELKTAGNGYDAGLFTEQFRPHLVILDYLLPDINGNHVCRRMRENPALATAKVLCVSGVINQPEIDALMQAGANAFLRKPFSIDELCKKIGELLEMEGVASPEQPA
ncbi:MAG TPA: response regulator [Phycisphaerales bacterium]|nr:response regulator [Phycisphaerales bacterium]